MLISLNILFKFCFNFWNILINFFFIYWNWLYVMLKKWFFIFIFILFIYLRFLYFYGIQNIKRTHNICNLYEIFWLALPILLWRFNQRRILYGEKWICFFKIILHRGLIHVIMRSFFFRSRYLIIEFVLVFLLIFFFINMIKYFLSCLLIILK